MNNEKAIMKPEDDEYEKKLDADRCIEVDVRIIMS